MRKFAFLGALLVITGNLFFPKALMGSDVLTPASAVAADTLILELKTYSALDLAAGNAIGIGDKFFRIDGCVNFMFTGFPGTTMGQKSTSNSRTALTQEKVTDYVKFKNGFHWKHTLKRILIIVLMILILITIMFVFGAPGTGKAVALAVLALLMLLYVGISYVLGSYSEVMVDNSYGEVLTLQIDQKKLEIPARAYCGVYMDMGERRIRVFRKDTGEKIDELIIRVPRAYVYPTTCSNMNQLVLNLGGNNRYSLSKIQYYSR